MRYLITPTLINSWSYYLNADDEWTDNARTSFMQTLSREKFEPNADMEKGNKFEADVYAYVDGYRPELVDIYWECVAEIATKLPGGARQVAVKSEIEIDGQLYLIYGKVDHLGGPWATDIKYTASYEFPKYKASAQHPLYLHCLPSVPSFRYLVCEDGRRVHEEVYQNGESDAVEIVREFIGSLKASPEACMEFDLKWRAYE